MNNEQLSKVKYRGLVDAKPAEPMTKEESMFLLQLGFLEMRKAETPQPISEGQRKILEEDSPFSAIIISRLQWATGLPWERIVGPEALMMISSLRTSDRPGNAVMWAYTLLFLRADEGEPVTIDLLSQRFPVGFPTAEAMHAVWDQQKVFNHKDEAAVHPALSDNMLDRPPWWENLSRIMTKSESVKEAVGV
jgi:hypothetical protein